MLIVAAQTHTRDKNSFVQLDKNAKSNITVGDGRTQEVVGNGWLL